MKELIYNKGQFKSDCSINGIKTSGYLERKKMESLIKTHIQVNYKRIKGLHLQNKILKHLEENLDKYPYDL